MIFLRSLVFSIYLTILTIIFGTLSGLLFLFPFHWRWKIITLWNKSIIWGAKVICGIRYQLKGTENIPDYPAVYLAKHQSAWETIALPIFLKRTSTYVHKKELNYIPFFGWGLASVQQIAIDRSARRDAMQQVMSIGSQRFKEGRNIIMFPEGTRIPVGQQGRYKTGGSRLATHLSADVIPIALNAGMCWPRNAFIKRPGLITISFGPAINSKGLTADQLNKQVEQWIETEMRVLNPEVYTSSTI
ncbi:1-acyl-sn-glycerol-3-phosphate acyltransferase [Pelistega indica]|uniref:1-acyl-sn-glycerol-3-phosphate acyltransferase n=1 Tax=Pelistega indica TaxID=1414851 RepID=V8G0Z7_9BURK|nr:lysophospholipid acyltransferase family protein [Pelistega indica]ETD70189.1 1-acyl-sn-glycerol-3-phosphate acyltransferase [Pelistega indica]